MNGKEPKRWKSTKKQIKAEEGGVWSKEVTFGNKSQPLSEELLSGFVGDINQEPDEIELDKDEKKEVNLLLDSTLAMNATSKCMIPQLEKSRLTQQ